MDNQHKKIKGYRDLSQTEIDLMNRIKSKAEEVGELIDDLEGVRNHQQFERPDGLTDKMLDESDDALTLATMNLKTGFMWLVRAVALPQSF